MEKFWILFLFFSINLLDKAESVKLELKTFDEIFGEGWDKGETEDFKTPAPTNFGQIEPNSTDQNAPLTESDHSDHSKNGEDQNEVSSNENIAENERKRKIVHKFIAIKEEFKQKGKYSAKEWVQIDNKIAKQLKVSRSKIYKWKKELDLSRKAFYETEERRHLVEKFEKMKGELKRDGCKSSLSPEIDKTVAKELGLNFATIYKWKRQLGQTEPKHKHSHSEQKELMKLYYEIKDKNPKISDEDIAKMLNIGRTTLVRWKKQFSNVQEIEKSNSESI